MILIYTENRSDRLEYIAEFIFNSVLNVEFIITTEEKKVKKHKDPVINYSKRPDIEGINIIPRELLFDRKIKNIKIEVFKWNGNKAFFKSNNEKGIPFDMFSASFYLISRYEEYNSSSSDKYNRFKAEDSVAYKNGFHDLPVVDIWAYKLKDIIQKKYPEFKFPERKFTFIPTIDIDNAWAYKYKGAFRTFGGMARSIFKFYWGDLFRRINVLLFRKTDPYDNYELIEKLHAKYKYDSIFFFLLCNNGKYDTSHEITNKNFRKLIKEISKKNHVGIHPSYTSNSKVSLIKEETATLAGIINKKVKRSRNHFLRIRVPQTFNALIKIGIEKDYSVGFSSQSGFRSGTCTPYKFYNLKRDIVTELEIIPFQIMDATLKFYLKLKPNDAIEHIRTIIKEIVKVDGTFVSVWHNESLSGKGIWKNWRFVYKELLDECFKYLN